MSDKWKLILIILVLIGCFVLFSLYFIVFESKRPGPRVEYGIKVGELAPDFLLPTLRRNSVRLSDYRGKVVFLNIWATWCPPCREEMPSMEALYRRLKGREFEMLTVSIDRDGEKVVRPFVLKYGLTFPVLLDPDNKTYMLYGLTGVPETFIIGRNGVIIFKMIGPQDWIKKEWLDYFDRILAQK
jgi:cytochrome c biogenesis protein CcmG/thiol:disulfide interchange protein DsbE